MSCPLHPNTDEDPTMLIGIRSTCDTIGRCMSVRELALYHKNAQMVTEPLEYGSHPLNGNTWDADRVYGCMADEYGYFKGGNISSGTPGDVPCPFGYDMRLMENIRAHNSSIANFSNYVEIQEIACKGDTGHFTVTFRGSTSDNIYAHYTTYQMAQVLSAVPTIGPVSVVLSTGSSTSPVCSTSDYVYVYMYSVLGDVPALTTDASSLKWRSRVGSATVTRIQMGSSRGLKECSGHGICNRATGTCECFEHWVSSDGFGNPGQRGDCGANDIL
jgi:hypothetical protein